MSEETRVLRTPKVRLSFPNLLSPRQFVDRVKNTKGAPRFSTDFLMEPADLDSFEVMGDKGWEKVKLKQVLADSAKAKWPDMNVVEAVKHGGLKWPIRNGDMIADKRDAEGKKHGDITRGKFVISAATKAEFAPQLFVLDEGKAVELSRDNVKDAERIRKLFVGGMYVVAGLKLQPNETELGKFLNLYLNSVLYVKPGPRIGGIDGETMFSGIEGGESDFDPTGGTDAADLASL